MKEKKELLLAIFILAALFFLKSFVEELEKKSLSNNNQNIIQTYSDTKENPLNRLKKGNEIYIDVNYNKNQIDKSTRKKLNEGGQKPYAVILTCSDSRVVPENIFYTGLGELFVIRVAGNVVDDAVLGSIEYAISKLDVPLVVVMGHDDCGVIKGASEKNMNGKLETIVKKIEPSYEKAKIQGGSKEEIYNNVVKFNTENSMNLIKENEIIKKYIDEKKVKVTGSNYDMETGLVKWLD
ncbi:carbonic anhydrase family protein [Paraclostridium bifermentans]|uniref:carbonic anhydrase n=1 Tax=Paraclostridium bifermentans TaxID=1490 RepID=UPI001C114D0A|nr:carbonic anhydrase [Paraclostridium bifermentans]MBS5952327.1 carbonic anhydrase [Paraclostridium bifermentans]MBU5287721.1 carbonic anhydrase [Paraclostridium bifermentans]